MWEVKRGDLVRLKDYPTGVENKYVYITGLVISGIKGYNDSQQSMWPTVDVYIFSTGVTRECGPGSLQIISNS